MFFYSMTLNKRHIVDSINKHHGLCKSESDELLERLLEIIENSLESGEDVLISGFGKFYVKEKMEQRGRHPLNDNDFRLGAKRVIRFRCSDRLRNKINRER